MAHRHRSAKERQAERRRAIRRRTEIKVALKDRPCADCGVRYPYYVMQFDHLPGFVKSDDVSRFSSPTAIRAESAKCEVVCANCHAERSWRRRAAQAPEVALAPSWAGV